MCDLEIDVERIDRQLDATKEGVKVLTSILIGLISRLEEKKLFDSETANNLRNECSPLEQIEKDMDFV